MPWKCFLVEESEFCRLSFRRFTFSSSGRTCKKGQSGGHDVAVVIDPQVAAEGARSSLKGEFEGDPRWPKTCACGYVFVEDDQWQVNYDRLYRGCPDGKLYVLRELPPGATWNAHWLAERDGGNGRYTGPDGKAWCVMMPGGVEWIVYSYASGPEPRRKWSVQGAVPNITVSPSIDLTGIYHGFIVGGIISEDHEGRRFEGIPRTA